MLERVREAMRARRDLEVRERELSELDPDDLAHESAHCEPAEPTDPDGADHPDNPHPGEPFDPSAS